MFVPSLAGMVEIWWESDYLRSKEIYVCYSVWIISLLRLWFVGGTLDILHVLMYFSDCMSLCVSHTDDSCKIG